MWQPAAAAQRLPAQPILAPVHVVPCPRSVCFRAVTDKLHLPFSPLLHQQLEDDLAVISSKLGFIPQLNGANFASATPLPVSATGATFTANSSGIISQTGQVDYFSFDASAGTLTLSVMVLAWTNLPVLAIVFDAAGNPVGSPINPVSAAGSSVTGLGFSNVTRSLPAAGRYYVMVAGTGFGDPANFWSSYGSLGQYHITASYPAPPPRCVESAAATQAGKLLQPPTCRCMWPFSCNACRTVTTQTDALWTEQQAAAMHA
jgi:hypothetical protein